MQIKQMLVYIYMHMCYQSCCLCNLRIFCITVMLRIILQLLGPVRQTEKSNKLYITLALKTKNQDNVLGWSERVGYRWVRTCFGGQTVFEKGRQMKLPWPKLIVYSWKRNPNVCTCIKLCLYCISYFFLFISELETR